MYKVQVHAHAPVTDRSSASFQPFLRSTSYQSANSHPVLGLVLLQLGFGLHDDGFIDANRLGKINGLTMDTRHVSS